MGGGGGVLKQIAIQRPRLQLQRHRRLLVPARLPGLLADLGGVWEVLDTLQAAVTGTARLQWCLRQPVPTTTKNKKHRFKNLEPLTPNPAARKGWTLNPSN